MGNHNGKVSVSKTALVSKVGCSEDSNPANVKFRELGGKVKFNDPWSLAIFHFLLSVMSSILEHANVLSVFSSHVISFTRLKTMPVRLSSVSMS